MQGLSLATLISLTRGQIDDGTAQPRVSDADLTVYLNEAETEACLRAKLIRDDTTNSLTRLVIPAPADPDVGPLAEDCTFNLKPCIFEIARVIDEDTGEELFEISEEELFARGRWQTERGSKATHYYVKQLPNDAYRIRLFPMPAHEDGQTIRLDVFRTPMNDMEEPDDEPEIGAVHHMKLIAWAKFRTYIVRDPDIESNADAAIALGQFEADFGLKDTASQRRRQRHRHAGVVRARRV